MRTDAGTRMRHEAALSGSIPIPPISAMVASARTARETVDIYRCRSVRRDAVFFFKQKTAYEIHRRLEFRRVLFRSIVKDGVVAERAAGFAPGFFQARRKVGGLLDNPHPAPASAEGGFHDQRESDFFRHVAGFLRSEERRVGKECRARWPASHYK